MSKSNGFMERVMSRIELELLVASTRFVRKLAKRLRGSRLSTRITAADVQAHYGPQTSFVRACIALSEIARFSFTFENEAGRHRHCLLIIYVDYDIARQFAQVYFTQEGRDMLRDDNGQWKLRMAQAHS
jgi:hypothetical protein